MSGGEANYSVQQAQKLAEKERKRVELHKMAREKALDLATEKKAKEILKEKYEREQT